MARDLDAEADYQQAMDSLRTLAIRDLVSWWKQTETLGFADAKQLMEEPFQAIIAAYGEQAAYAAADYLFRSRSLDDNLRGLEYPEVADPAGFEQILGSYAWALNTSRTATGDLDRQLALRKLAGITNRLVQQPARETVYQATRKAGTRYARVPEPHACVFCLLLASRGAVYSRDTVLLTEAGKKYHDNCKCLGIEVQTPADLPKINQELEQIYIKSGKYPGSDQEAFAEAIERHRNQTPDWVPPDAIRYRRAVDMSKASGDRKITVKEALDIGLADDTAWPEKEDRIRKWLEDNGAQSVIKLKELDKIPGGAGLRFRDRTGISNTPDAIVDGVTTEMKSITSKNGINNRGRKGKKQSDALIYDLRGAEHDEKTILADLRRAVDNNGADLDRIVVITKEKTILWERS